MIRLDQKDFCKALTPLSKVKINTMFAEAVVKQIIPGFVYSDHEENPRSFYILHPYGMSLVFGADDNDRFNNELLDYITDRKQMRNTPEWLQADPAGAWSEIIDSAIGSELSIIKNNRVNFSFNPEKYQLTREQLQSRDYEVVRTTEEMFLNQIGSVTAKSFWRDAEQFLTAGIGYSVIIGGEISATAFSAFRDDHRLEIGIETSEAHRGQGYAYSVCSALIDYCLVNRLEPVWSCRLENEGSYRLALKLGFEPVLTIPYYRLAEQRR
jgi:RimJ/RimL family protein N-acetyltransferase